MAAKRPEHPALNWSDLDRRAVDTVRVLAMDAVEKSGNGHPGTAMSLAPAAYLLFNRVMRHNPADPNWPGRDRFVLSAGHSSLTLYIQLFLSGYPLSLDDLQVAAAVGLADAGSPRARAHPGRGDHHRPARAGPGQRDNDALLSLPPNLLPLGPSEFATGSVSPRRPRAARTGLDFLCPGLSLPRDDRGRPLLRALGLMIGAASRRAHAEPRSTISATGPPPSGPWCSAPPET